jgi:hypothetical protein
MSEEQARYVLEPQTRQYIDDKLLSGKAGRPIAETRDLLAQGLQQKATAWLDDFNERVAIAVKEMVLLHGYSVKQVEDEYDRAYGQPVEHTARAQARLAAGWWVRVRDKEAG